MTLDELATIELEPASGEPFGTLAERLYLGLMPAAVRGPAGGPLFLARRRRRVLRTGPRFRQQSKITPATPGEQQDHALRLFFAETGRGASRASWGDVSTSSRASIALFALLPLFACSSEADPGTYQVGSSAGSAGAGSGAGGSGGTAGGGTGGVSATGGTVFSERRPSRRWRRRICGRERRRRRGWCRLGRRWRGRCRWLGWNAAAVPEAPAAQAAARRVRATARSPTRWSRLSSRPKISRRRTT